MRFSLKDLFLCVTLIGVGLWCVAFVLSFLHHNTSAVGRARETALLLWIVGGTVGGAGILTPFRRAFIGALAGAAIQFIIAVIFIIKMISMGRL